MNERGGDTDVAIVGAGPYGLSVAAHLAHRDLKHRIFGEPMQFWRHIAAAGSERYLKSFCFGTDLSMPEGGSSFADFSRPRGLETFEPCSIQQFSDYGQWFQRQNVPWVEPLEVLRVEPESKGFKVTLRDGESLRTSDVVVATGLACYAHVPERLRSLSPARLTHTSSIAAFSAFQGCRVAVVGAGQSALEAAALLHEAGAEPVLLVRAPAIYWHRRVTPERALWRQLRSPISKLGTGPKAWALSHFPGAVHRWPAGWRTRFVKSHLPAEGAWWLRPRVENRLPVHLGTSVVKARESGSAVRLKLHDAAGGVSEIEVDHVIAGSGYRIDVDRLEFLSPELRRGIRRIEGAPELDASFQTSVRGLRFVGTASAMSFGPLFRFVVGADYTARVVASALASRVALAA